MTIRKQFESGSLLLIHARELVRVSGFAARRGAEMKRLEVIPDGALLIENGIISWVGRTEELILGGLSQYEEKYPLLDASGKAVLPGFVDSHTHFLFAGTREDEFALRLAGVSYMEMMRRGGGIIRTVRATRSASAEELFEEGKKRLDSMLSFGVTTVEGKSGYGLDLETELKQLKVMALLDRHHPVDVVPTFLGAHALPPEYAGRRTEYIRFLTDEVLPIVAEEKLARFCDIFCEEGVFTLEESRTLLTEAKRAGLIPKIHADEMVSLGGARLAVDLEAVSADHLLHTTDGEIDALAHSETIATLLPITAFSLKVPYARAREMIDRGCAVALATDMNPGSSYSESIPLLISLATLYMKMTPEEAVTALTLNGAAAIRREKEIGSLDVGKQGDVVILDAPSYRFLPYHIGVNLVDRVIKRGRIVYEKEKGVLGGVSFPR